MCLLENLPRSFLHNMSVTHEHTSVWVVCVLAGESVFAGHDAIGFFLSLGVVVVFVNSTKVSN